MFSIVQPPYIDQMICNLDWSMPTIKEVSFSEAACDIIHQATPYHIWLQRE